CAKRLLPVLWLKYSVSMEAEHLSVVSKLPADDILTFLSSICFLLADSARRMRVERSSPVRGSLAEQVVLPCYFSILPAPTGSSSTSTTALRIKWTKLVGDEEMIVIVTQNGFLKIGPEFKGRVSIPSHFEDVGDASLTIERLRASDAGAYRCEVMHGIEDTQESVSLKVSGQSFSMQIMKGIHVPG
uniref:Ig-like domain-containing protein n=1 Tax=Sinocyclocheilus grahami TaxID=75366 RepID=A0A672R144_SINGR